MRFSFQSTDWYWHARSKEEEEQRRRVFETLWKSIYAEPYEVAVSSIDVPTGAYLAAEFAAGLDE